MSRHIYLERLKLTPLAQDRNRPIPPPGLLLLLPPLLLPPSPHHVRRRLIHPQGDIRYLPPHP